MDIQTLVWLLPLPPLLAFFLIILFTNRGRALSHSIAVGAALLSWLGSMIVFFQAISVEHLGEHPFESVLNWLPVGDGWFKVGVLVDPLTAVSVFFVAWTVLMIFIYSIGYHNFGQPKGDHDRKGLPPHGATVTDEHGHKHTVPSIEPMYSRFFAFIGLFAFGMYTLVLSDNLLTMFVGWEVMGLCSYLLIGFWYGKESARNAMIKAFMTTRVGDVFMLLGIAWLYSATGTLSFREIFWNEEVLHHLVEMPGFFGMSVAASIGILLFIGTVGKSAQFPLHVWLPDAMEGPTPVSAMIHAAAMVSAGVYAVIRMYPLLSAGMEHGAFTPPMLAMAGIGAFTALFAATIAVAQNDIKRVLAYSTISQLGYMIAALGIGGYVAATFHLITHAFFKALLFLGSGAVIHGMEHGVFHTGKHIDPQDMFNMGGLRKKMPITYITFLAGGLALAGFPFVTAGFWSKDEILADAFQHAPLVFVVLGLAALLTAFYTMRQIVLTFGGKPRTEAAEHAQEVRWTMWLPLTILAIFAIAAGWVGIPEALSGGLVPNWFHEFVGGSLPEHPETLSFNIIPLITSLVVSLGGLGLGLWYYSRVKTVAEDRFQIPLLKNKYYFDEIYDRYVVRPLIWVAEVFTNQFLDRGVIDGFLHAVARLSSRVGSFLREYIDKPVINGLIGDGSASLFQSLARFLRPIQTGRIQQYMLIAFVLAFTTLFYYIYTLLQP
ncbi:MAG: NADH-quinone oxidoreductase subunit L [Anaerolineales bacterium]|nr:NADH-quinone oxidoreductase subunit L [Anaerolineales bacterium]